MPNFHQRWLQCAAAARQHPVPAPPLPPGFAARVLARHAQPSAPSTALLWLTPARWTLAGATALMLLCALLDLSSRPTTPTFRPHLETAVAEIFTGL